MHYEFNSFVRLIVYLLACLRAAYRMHYEHSSFVLLCLFDCLHVSVRLNLLLEALQLSKNVPGLFLVVCFVFSFVCAVLFVFSRSG